MDCNHFRYGQCNTQVHGETEVVCRLVICQHPGAVPGLNCNSTEMIDDNTCSHEAGCLKGLAIPGAGRGRGCSMTAIVSVETVLLVILVVLVAGLLRSHAEILRSARRGRRTRDAPAMAPVPRWRAPERARGAPRPPIAGSTPDADAIALDLAAPAARRCSPSSRAAAPTCAAFWAGLHEARLPGRGAAGGRDPRGRPGAGQPAFGSWRRPAWRS